MSGLSVSVGEPLNFNAEIKDIVLSIDLSKNNFKKSFHRKKLKCKLGNK